MSAAQNGFAKAVISETICQYGDLSPGIQELLLSAIAVRRNAYAVYSGFKVGAAFRATDQRIFTGCNVENAAFTPTSCAERTALSKAISEGSREFIAGAVVAYEPDVFTTPCGVCRQFIREFSHEDLPIYITKAYDERPQSEALRPDDTVLCTSIYNLLPCSFRTYKK